MFIAPAPETVQIAPARTEWSNPVIAEFMQPLLDVAPVATTNTPGPGTTVGPEIPVEGIPGVGGPAVNGETWITICKWLRWLCD